MRLVYGEQVAHLERVRFVIQHLFDHTSDCSFISLAIFPHAFAGVSLENIGKELGCPDRPEHFFMSLAFWPEVLFVV